MSSSFDSATVRQSDTNPQSSPDDRSGKPRGKPTVTPRSFTRFFTPRISIPDSRKHGSTRNPLKDITSSATNKIHRVGKRRSPRKDSIRLFDEDENPDTGSNNLPNGRKRALYSPETTPELSSPLKRFRSSRYERSSDLDLQPPVLPGNDRDQVLDSGVLPKHISRSSYRTHLGQVSRRELDIPSRFHDRHLQDYCTDWRSQAAGFYTAPEDVHITRNLASDNTSLVIPFCTAACNTNSLIAVGDEEGSVRLLETEKNNKTSFKVPFLSFRPHVNAILDLDFSYNDALLATASGDQTGHVIDMSTQSTIYQMQGHCGSVKQVRFQPSSGGSVLATSSRDGDIQIWDLRCKGYSAPVTDLKINLGGADSEEANTFTSGSKIRRATRVSFILEAHGGVVSHADGTYDTTRRLAVLQSVPAKKPARNEVSITALSWMRAESPHFLLSGSEANAVVKLWDIRMKPNARSQRISPISSTEQPTAHYSHRTFGLTSMALSGDGSRLYTLCKDSTVYTYSTKHMVLGSAPELGESWRPRKTQKEHKGLGPLYAFRHERLKAATFYVKSALRPAKFDRGELLAVGSTDSCAVLFPTDERQIRAKQFRPTGFHPDAQLTPALTPKSARPPLTRSNSGYATMRLAEDIPVFTHGAALRGGHQKEITGTTWTSEGELVTLGDDHRCRVWREDQCKAASLRDSLDSSDTWGHGWAELGSDGLDWDKEE